jgi:hypothetical protein
VGVSSRLSLQDANHYFKPFKVGHTIEAQGVFATVSDIQIL